MMARLWERFTTALIQTLVGLGVLALFIALAFGLWACVHICTSVIRLLLNV